MLLNKTQETCAGTGNVLTLSGATAGNAAFGAVGNGEDGKAYSCVVDDGDGTKSVAGLYVFDKTANTFTRDDSWNMNGGVVDKSPAINITLSGGTHTISCDTTVNTIGGMTALTASAEHASFTTLPDNIISSDVDTRHASFSMCLVPAFFSTPIDFTKLAAEVSVADVAGLCEIGIYSVGLNGDPEKLICSAALDITTTASRRFSTVGQQLLPAGRYFTAVWINSLTAKLWSASTLSHGGRPGAFINRNDNPGIYLFNPSPDTGLPASVAGESFLFSDRVNGAFLVGFAT